MRADEPKYLFVNEEVVENNNVLGQINLLLTPNISNIAFAEGIKWNARIIQLNQRQNLKCQSIRRHVNEIRQPT